MTDVHSSEAFSPRRRRISGRPWTSAALLASFILLTGALIFALTRLPPTWRIRMDHEVASFVTDAPVLLLGDSITYANGPMELCDEAVFNAAVPGAKLKDILNQGLRLAERVRPERVVVAIGVNDAMVPHTSIAHWTAQYRRLLASLAGADLVLVEVNPVDSRFPVVARSFDHAFIAQQNTVIRDLAARSGARLVPAPASSGTFDGLHPDDAGGAGWRERLAHAACAG